MGQQWDLMNKRLMELEKQMQQKLEKLETELTEKNNIIQQLTAELEQLRVPAAPASIDLINSVKEYQALIADFDKEKEKYLTEIIELNQKINFLQKSLEEYANAVENAQNIEKELSGFQKKIKELENEKQELSKELQNLKEKQGNSIKQEDKLGVNQKIIKHEELDQALSESHKLKQKNEVLIAENQNLKSDIEKLHNEMDELVKISHQKSERINTLETKLLSTPQIATKEKTSPPEQVSTPNEPQTLAHGKRNFEFVKGKFVETTNRSNEINLELDEKAKKWILTINSSVDFLKKNKALRVARSIPKSGWKSPDRHFIGKGYDLEIIGEY
ncbi:MAG: hypothetical protein ACFFD2_14410 [Promethearchaeota archaeon]